MTDLLSSSLLDARIRVGRLSPPGRSLDLDADEQARQAIAGRLGILGVDRFQAHVQVSPFRGGFRITGRLGADVRQQCVVTLEPVPETISEVLNRVFLPGRPPESDAREQERFVDAEGEDEPDWFEGEYLDLAPLLIETLALSLDPYPRAPGAAVQSAADAPSDHSDSPFAGLARLKPGVGRP